VTQNDERPTATSVVDWCDTHQPSNVASEMDEVTEGAPS
jgi:hypothetical protein